MRHYVMVFQDGILYLSSSVMMIVAIWAQIANDPRIDYAAILLALASLTTAAVPITIKVIDAFTAMIDRIGVRREARELRRLNMANLKEEVGRLGEQANATESRVDANEQRFVKLSNSGD